MGRPDFGRSAPYPAPPFAHALHDDDVDGVVAEGMDDGLPAEPVVQLEPKAEPEPEPALPLGCRWRVPLTRVLNPSGVLLIIRVLICIESTIFYYTTTWKRDIVRKSSNGK